MQFSWRHRFRTHCFHRPATLAPHTIAIHSTLPKSISLDFTRLHASAASFPVPGQVNLGHQNRVWTAQGAPKTHQDAPDQGNVSKSFEKRTTAYAWPERLKKPPVEVPKHAKGGDLGGGLFGPGFLAQARLFGAQALFFWFWPGFFGSEGGLEIKETYQRVSKNPKPRTLGQNALRSPL